MSRNDDVAITCNRVGVGLSWDAGAANVDADLQAVAFDSQGKPMDAVYYNNMKAFRNGMTHSGDELTGEKHGLDEVVWIVPSKLPAEAKLIAFVVACYKGGHLKDLVNGKVHLLENTPETDVMQWSLERSDEEVDLVSVLFRDDYGTWHYRTVEEPAQDGQHFIDILEPVIGNVVRKFIPGAPRRIKACFAMEKGSLVDLPKSSELSSVRIGLGWDAGAKGVDLDVSAVLLTSGASGRLEEVTTVFFGNLVSNGVTHSGDNLTGEGDGDDEVITIDLVKVPPAVSQIFLVINIYTKGKNFSMVQNPYARVLTQVGDELCRYQLRDAGRQNGLAVARLMRAPDGIRWGFQALGQPCNGSMYKDSLGFIKELGARRATELQLQCGGSTEDFAAVSGAPGPFAAAPAMMAASAPPKPASSTCMCQ